jgi:hypothetical protein
VKSLVLFKPAESPCILVESLLRLEISVKEGTSPKDKRALASMTTVKPKADRVK